MRILAIFLILFSYTAFAEAPIETYGFSPWGDLKYKPGFAHFDYVNPDAPRGGEARLGAIGSFDSLNPYIVKGNKTPYSTMIFESLLSGSADEPQSAYGLVAKSIILAPDRSYAEFVMRPEARFQDASKLTADDVVFSLNTLKKDGDPSYRIAYEPIASVEKLGPYRVRFHFSDRKRRDLPLIAGGMPIFSKVYYTTHEFNKTTLEPPLGSGPYKIKSVDQGRSIVYERVKDYWGERLPVNVGQNNFDTIRVDMYRDETVALEAFKAGNFDYREENVARSWATGYNFPAVVDGRVKKVLIPNDVPQGMQGFLFNIRRDIFADRRVRKAVGLTLDFEWMNKTLFYNSYRRDDSFFENTPFAESGLPQGEELKLLEPFKDKLPPGLLTEKFTLPKTDGSGNNRPELIEADKLLNDAGWVVKDGVRVNAATGAPLTFEFLLDSESFERVAAPMRRHLKTLGIDAHLRVIDSAQFVKRVETYDYDMMLFSYNHNVFYPADEQLIYWHSTQADQPGSSNFVGAKSPVIDALLAKIVGAENLAELTPAARALDRVLLWEWFIVPQWRMNAFRVAYWDKFGKPEIMPRYSVGFPSVWWRKSTP